MKLVQIKNFLQNQSLDIRVTRNARFMDQKCTPDVISTIAECIQNFSDELFCVKDIWQSEFAEKTILRFFQKPETTNTRTTNEYDKFFGQPIKLFEYAGIIALDTSIKKRSNYYKVENRDILNWIAISDKKAFDFLTIYLKEVLSQSEIYSWFENFLEKNNDTEFDKLKSNFENFIIENTPINQTLEVRRIFTKIINPLAVEKNKPGTRRGRYSKDNILYEELLYNRINFRDINKPKNIPRAVFLQQNSHLSEQSSYNVEKAKRQIKRYQGNISEVHPKLAGFANHAHHIFPQSSYIELSDTLENLIVLTPEEHFEFAHKNSLTSSVSLGYQMVCLMCKAKSIHNSKSIMLDDFYSYESYINTLEIGLNTNFTASIQRSPEKSLKNIHQFIINHYLTNSGNNKHKISIDDLINIIINLSITENISLSEKQSSTINKLFKQEVVKSSITSTKHALNIVANLSLNK